jgi:hypothetical protein
MEQEEPIQEAAREMGLITGGEKSTFDKASLAARINELIDKEFQKLVTILYRMDVSEPKLRSLLNDNPGADAGLLIAELMIERQVQKIRSRKEYKQRDQNIEEDEKW